MCVNVCLHAVTDCQSLFCLFRVHSRELMCGFEQRQAYLLSVSDDSVLSLGTEGLWESK